MEPKILRADSWLITATGGASLSSCHAKALPDSRLVPAARKYSGDMLNIRADAAAFAGLKSEVCSLKTNVPFAPPDNGDQSTSPTDVTPGIVSRASIMCLCMADIRSLP